MSSTAKSRFILGRNTFGGFGRRALSNRAEVLSASSAVRGGAALAMLCARSMEVVLADDMQESHRLRVSCCIVDVCV